MNSAPVMCGIVMVSMAPMDAPVGEPVNRVTCATRDRAAWMDALSPSLPSKVTTRMPAKGILVAVGAGVDAGAGGSSTDGGACSLGESGFATRFFGFSFSGCDFDVALECFMLGLSENRESLEIHRREGSPKVFMHWHPVICLGCYCMGQLNHPRGGCLHARERASIRYIHTDDRGCVGGFLL